MCTFLGLTFFSLKLPKNGFRVDNSENECQNNYQKLSDTRCGNFQTKRTTSLAKWLSVRLRTKWSWVRVQLQSLHHFTFPILPFVTFLGIACGSAYFDWFRQWKLKITRKLSLTCPFQDFYQFVEDGSNVLPKSLPNGCFRILLAASIFYFRQISL